MQNTLLLTCCSDALKSMFDEGGLQSVCKHHVEDEDEETCDCSNGVQYLCLHCGDKYCSHHEKRLAEDHWRDTDHCFMLSLFDLTIWCHDCKKYYRHPTLEALPKKLINYKGWGHGFEVEYDKVTVDYGNKS